jgi:hypothetical protein
MRKHIYQWTRRDCEHRKLFTLVAQKTLAPGERNYNLLLRKCQSSAILPDPSQCIVSEPLQHVRHACARSIYRPRSGCACGEEQQALTAVRTSSKARFSFPSARQPTFSSIHITNHVEDAANSGNGETDGSASGRHIR